MESCFMAGSKQKGRCFGTWATAPLSADLATIMEVEISEELLSQLESPQELPQALHASFLYAIATAIHTLKVITGPGEADSITMDTKKHPIEYRINKAAFNLKST